MDAGLAEDQPLERPTRDGSGADAGSFGPYGGKDSAGADVVAALCERMGAVQFGEDRRRSERLPWLRRVPVWVAEETGSGQGIRKLDALIHDISHGGFGFIFDQELDPGMIIRARFDGLPNRPVVTGVIRYCVQLGATHHRIGVQFTK